MPPPVIRSWNSAAKGARAFYIMGSAEIISFDTTFRRAEEAARSTSAAPMRSDLVEQASKIIPHPPLLINVVSQRVRQLNQGRPPLVDLTGRRRYGQADIALQEIIEGKIVVENGHAVEANADPKEGRRRK